MAAKQRAGTNPILREAVVVLLIVAVFVINFVVDVDEMIKTKGLAQTML